MVQYSQHSNPALSSLEGWVGAWEMELFQMSFLPDPSDTVKGPVLIALWKRIPLVLETGNLLFEFVNLAARASLFAIEAAM